MTIPQSRQFLIGLPAAGKTTFLAALWHVVVSGEVDGALKLERLEGDKEYLNKIRDLWSNVKPLDRTNPGSEMVVSMLLKHPSENTVTEVIFPDLSGESFTSQWTHRKMKRNHAELVREAVGGLLLIHPETVIPEALIPETEGIIESIRSEMQSGHHTGMKESQTVAVDTHQDLVEMDWKPEKAPTQIQLVDLLQFIAALNTKRPIRLGAVVSAWDCITDTISPKAWVEKYLPLLSQYLTTNSEVFYAEFYGVSAQGGKLEDADALQKKSRPSDRIRVIMNDLSESHDITIPVRWIMEPLA